jgi:hypothetical protein
LPAFRAISEAGLGFAERCEIQFAVDFQRTHDAQPFLLSHDANLQPAKLADLVIEALAILFNRLQVSIGQRFRQAVFDLSPVGVIR